MNKTKTERKIFTATNFTLIGHLWRATVQCEECEGPSGLLLGLALGRLRYDFNENLSCDAKCEVNVGHTRRKESWQRIFLKDLPPPDLAVVRCYFFGVRAPSTPNSMAGPTSGFQSAR